MNEDNKLLFKEYSDLDAQEKAIKAQKVALAPQLTAVIEEEEGKQIKADYGTFFLTARKTWSYPSYVKEAEETLKSERIKSEENGDATSEEKKSLTFRATKIE